MDPPAVRALFDLTDRVAIVTGGTRGIGLAIASGFVGAGAKVVVASRKPHACESTETRTGCAAGRASSTSSPPARSCSPGRSRCTRRRRPG